MAELPKLTPEQELAIYERIRKEKARGKNAEKYGKYEPEYTNYWDSVDVFAEAKAKKEKNLVEYKAKKAMVDAKEKKKK